MKKTITLVLVSMLLLSGLSFSPTQQAKAQGSTPSSEFVKVKLYLHEGEIMDTKKPTTENKSSANLKDGEKVSFETAPLEHALSVANEYFTFRFTINISVKDAARQDEVSVNLTISVFSSDEKVATGVWDSRATHKRTWNNESKTINFEKGWDKTFDKHNKIILTITSDVKYIDNFPEAGERPYTVEMYYDAKKMDTSLELECAPVEITGETYGKDKKSGVYLGEPSNVFYPGLPSELAYIKFEGEIANAFGAEDVKWVKLNIKGAGLPEGKISINLTEEMGIKSGYYKYEWNYSKYSLNLENRTYVANLSVKTFQHLFYHTLNFSFAKWGVLLRCDKEEQIIAKNETAIYQIEVWNIGTTAGDVEVSTGIAYDSPNTSWGKNLVSNFHISREATCIGLILKSLPIMFMRMQNAR